MSNAKLNSPVVIDHVVLLLDDREFENPPSWLTNNFTIFEGGTHAGGASRNKLIVFLDGTYLELFNWVKPPGQFPAWSHKKPGLIDFAMATLPPVSAEANHGRIVEALQHNTEKLGISFEEPKAGGRLRQIGEESHAIKWQTTRPLFAASTHTPESKYYVNGRLDSPFFCHDVTDRVLRVPSNDPKLTRHACGAVGISSIEFVVPASHLSRYATTFGDIFNTSTVEKQNAGSRIGLPVATPNPQLRSSGDDDAYIIIESPEEDDMSTKPNGEQNLKSLTERGIGISGLTLKVSGDGTQDRKSRTLDFEGIGMTVKLSL